MTTKEEIIEQLGLQPHPEGGYFKETYRSEGVIGAEQLPDNYGGSRNHSTCIYFLLTSDTFSAFHRINQDEIWHFYAGAPIELHTLNEAGEHQVQVIGTDFTAGQVPQLVVAGGDWFAASVLEGEFALVGCTVAPGFSFDDFELPTRAELLEKFPQHQALIERYSRL